MQGFCLGSSVLILRDCRVAKLIMMQVIPKPYYVRKTRKVIQISRASPQTDWSVTKVGSRTTCTKLKN